MKLAPYHAALFFIVLLPAMLPAPLAADILKTIHAEWEYGGNATAFRLYREGTLLCESFDTARLAMDCETLIGDTPITFTMTAMGPDGETPHSAPFILVPPPLDDYGNTTPTAACTANVSSGQAPLAVAFDASLSVDPDGSLIDFAWDFGDGHVATGMLTNHTFYLPGTYAATLTVTDNEGGTAQTRVAIVVNELPVLTPTNTPPTANMNVVAVTPYLYRFTAYDSEDAEGLIIGYSWDFGDGSTTSGPYAEHPFTAAGTYLITLTTTDDDGATARTQTSITVPPATSSAEEQQQITVNWDYADRTAISAFRLYRNGEFICQTSNSEATELRCLTPLEPGPITFTMTAVDRYGNESRPSNGLTWSATTMQRNVTISWDYNDRSAISGFRLYRNETFVCETHDPEARELSCLTILEDFPTTFALKAIDREGKESTLSAGITYSPLPATSGTAD